MLIFAGKAEEQTCRKQTFRSGGHHTWRVRVPRHCTQAFALRFRIRPKVQPRGLRKVQHSVLFHNSVQRVRLYISHRRWDCGIRGKGAEKIAHNPLVGAMATTYILVTGVVYTAGIPMGFTPPFQWHDAYHAMNSFIQVYFHMIIPPVMLILWFFPLADRQVKHSRVWYFAVYPLVYSVFSIMRGALGTMHFYPYPFYRPEFIWSLFSSAPVNYAAAYVLMALVLAVGLLLFVGIGRLMVLINDKAAYRVFGNVRPRYVRTPQCTTSGRRFGRKSTERRWNRIRERKKFSFSRVRATTVLRRTQL